jgi:hypothetical protein
MPSLQFVSYGSNEPYVASQFEWSVSTFHEWHWYFRCKDSGGQEGTNTAVSNNNRTINNRDSCNNHTQKNYEKGLRGKLQQSREPALIITNYNKDKNITWLNLAKRFRLISSWSGSDIFSLLKYHSAYQTQGRSRSKGLKRDIRKFFQQCCGSVLVVMRIRI